MQEKQKKDLPMLLFSLCNLNFVGAGYLLAGLKKRWLIALGGNFVLLIAGHLLNASRQPVVWAIIFIAVYVGMAIDLLFLVKKDADLIPEKLTKKAFLLPLISAAMILVLLGGFFAYRFTGTALIAHGETAFEEGDFQAAFKDLYSVDRLYRLSLNPAVPAIEPMLNEISVVITAQSYAGQNDFIAALEAVDKFHKFYPDSPNTILINDLAIDQNLAKASAYQEEGDFEACRDQLTAIAEDYPQEFAVRQEEIVGAEAENYLKWGESLSEAQDYESALMWLELVVNHYKSAPAYEAAYQAAGQAHYDLAMQYISDDRFAFAEESLLKVQEKYSDAAVYQKSLEVMPDLLLDWGAQLVDDGSYMLAMSKFDQVADLTSDNKLLEQAENGSLEIIPLLARDDGSDGALVISQAAAIVCEDGVVEDPAVDIYPEENGKAYSCGGSGSVNIPNLVKADIPGTFRYVVSFEDKSRRVQSCDYVSSAGNRVLERWQHGTKVTILYVKNGAKFKEKTFYGNAPDPCPDERWFTMAKEKQYGDEPDEWAIGDWIETVIVDEWVEMVTE